MKKHALLPLFIMFMAVSVSLSSSAVAIFLPKAELGNVHFETLDAKLLISQSSEDVPPTESFQPTLLGGMPHLGLQPGAVPTSHPFWLKLQANTAHVYTVSAHFPAFGENWETLKDVIEVNITTADSSAETGWLTIEQWQQKRSLPGEQYRNNHQEKYFVKSRLKETYTQDPDGAGPLAAGSPVGNELMGKVSGMTSLILEATAL